MTYNGKAAYAAWNRQSNDKEDSDDAVDPLSERFVRIVRALIPDECLRAIVLADAFAKCYVEDFYTGNALDDMEDAKGLIGELVATHILDSDPTLCSDPQSHPEDYGHDPCRYDRQEDACKGCPPITTPEVRRRRRHDREGP